MLRNPYKTTKKRVERPWESQAVEEDPFDCGIDWDEASRLLDTTVSASAKNILSKAPKPCNNQGAMPTSVTPILSQNCSAVSKPVQLKQYQPRQCENRSLNSVSTNSAVTSKPPSSSVPSHKVPSSLPPCPSHSRPPVKSTAQRSARLLAAQRPESWKASVPASIPTLKHSSNKYNDPRQETLPPPLQFDPESVKPVQDSHRADLVLNANLSATLLNGWTLFPHQKRAILSGLKMRRMILALDMGLGKTLIGCVWSKAFLKTFEAVKVLVICPVSLQAEWKRTAVEATGLTVSSKPAKWLDQEEGCIETDDSQVYITSWAKVPPRITASEQYIVVCDEAHSMQSLESARTKVTLSLMKGAGCIGVLLLTGTPMKNGKPVNLFPLLKAVRHPLGRHQKAFEAHFCGGREVRFGSRAVWQANGSSNVDQLRTLSRSHLLHLTKEGCLKDLPSRTRVFQKVPVSSRRQLQHNQALQDLAKIHQTASKDSEAILGAIQRLRMVGALGKIEASVRLALNVLEKEPAVVIFTTFVEVAKAVHSQLGEAGWQGELLTGATAPKKRQDLVDRFQAGLSPVFVCTFGAGGVGLTLTAAHTIILIDRPWTPGEAHQAEDRVRRIGQTKPVRSIWVTAFEVDEYIDKLLEEKTQTTNAVLAGGGSNEASVQRSIVQQLMKNFLHGTNRDGLVQSQLTGSQVKKRPTQ